MLCARECPDWCIYIDSHKETLPATTEGGRERQRNVLDRFAIDFSLCMYCGICIEVCPFDALHWSPEFEYAETDIRDLLHEKERLGQWMQTVPPPPALDAASAQPAEVAAVNAPPRAGGLRERPAPPDRAYRQGGTADAGVEPRSSARDERGRGAGVVTTRDIVFAVVGLIAAVSAILAVTTRNVVHAALWLVVSLGTIAGCYVVLGAELVALVQVLIYVGAVVVLVLFALMLTRAPIGPNRDIAGPWWQRLLAAVLAVSVAVLLAVTLIPLVGEGAQESTNGDTRAVATAVFGTWVWPFELLSVLLLAALIGAFALAKIAGAGLVRRPRRRRAAPAPPPSTPSTSEAASPTTEPVEVTAPESEAATASASAREGGAP